MKFCKLCKLTQFSRSTAQHSTAQHSTAQHSTAQHSTAQHSTAQHSTAQHTTHTQPMVSTTCPNMCNIQIVGVSIFFYILLLLVVFMISDSFSYGAGRSHNISKCNNTTKR
jgi:hypothetical protein